jgi:flagellar assembly protein FliH
VDVPDFAQAIDEAYQRGLVDGRRDATDEALAAMDAAAAAERARLAETITAIGGLRHHVLAAAEHDVAHLAAGIARRILHREVTLDADILVAMARVAVGRLGERVSATVYLHPTDLASIVARRGDAPADDTLVLREDPALPRGGCRVESAAGEVDLGVDAQVSELARLLMGDAPVAPVDGDARCH